MGYVDDQITKYRREYADAVSGKRVRDSIRQLQDRANVRDTLAEAKKRGAIAAKRKIAKRSATRIDTEPRTLYSSDGIFELDYEHVLTG